MWNVNPRFMCRQHLLGEHLEMHMFVGAINKGKKLDGFVKNGLVEMHNIKKRHDELVHEMRQRGYNHKSPLDYSVPFEIGKVDVVANFLELSKRCEKCAARQERGLLIGV